MCTENNYDTYLNTNGTLYTCTTCGDTFICYPEWAYVKKKKGKRVAVFCTYGCMRKYQRERGEIK